ncbi:hypothetical protein E1161_23120 [Saccharopolyspora aridisoli]|uniref:Muconolactone isomerase domain-containing protein n=1 Tax=Saccharopolyspora aridisoli TaxID=2530385 RepID=A0A4R4UBA3_9PSEU|nr:DUF3303 family protein [Saccharopolyspora aridisoli]TDC88807.1 hypothetical protein E1161_23120 [Saccharopolyspora aridisoli]
MRMLVRVRPDLRVANSAIADGSMKEAMERAHERLKPEASYFLPQDGQRTALFICDIPDESQIVALLDPFFSNLEAKIDVFPVMNFDDLRAGWAQLARG